MTMHDLLNSISDEKIKDSKVVILFIYFSQNVFYMLTQCFTYLTH